MKTLPPGFRRCDSCFGWRLRALVCGGFVLLGLVAWQPLSAQTLLLNDNFSDSERVTQGLPSSAYWYVSTSGQTSVSSGGLSTTTNAGQNFFANFTSGTGSAQTLNVGDSLTLAFTFSVTGAIDSSAGGFINGFRVGLLNSNGAAFTDSAGIFNSGFNAFTGYFAALNLKTSSVLDNPPIGLLLFREPLSGINAAGLVLCCVGLWLLSLR